MELTILGSGTGLPNPRRGAAGYAVSIEDELMLLDCGPGTMARLLDTPLDYRRIDRVFLSHHHPDHCLDLVALIFANNFADRRPLQVVGPPGTNRFVHLLSQALPGLAPARYELVVEDWTSGRLDLAGGTVESSPVVHADVPALGYRLTARGRVLVYSGDTGECPEIVALARDAHTLLIECSYPDSVKGLKAHLTPSAAGRIAAQARAQRVVLTHLYPPCEQVDVKAQCAREFAGDIIVAEDLMTLQI